MSSSGSTGRARPPIMRLKLATRRSGKGQGVMAAMISRDWSCLNRACARQFHSFEAYPTCPHCGCVKVSWVPGGCHVPKVAPEADRTVTKLARIYNLTDMNSARRYECAKKIAPQPDASSQPMWSFGAGFNMQAHPDQAMCSPTKTP